MELPAQVKQAETAAEDLLKKAQVATDPVTPEDGKTEPTKQDPPDETVEGLKKQLADATHRFNVLQGKYNAEIEPIKADVNLLTRLKADVKSLRQQIENLSRDNAQKNNLVVDLTKKLEETKKAPPAAAVPQQDPSKVLTPEEMEHLKREDLSGETLNIFWKLINAAKSSGADTQQFETKFNELDQKIGQVNQKVDTTVQVSFDQRLRAAVPNIDKYIGNNADPAFVTWLDTPYNSFGSATPRSDLQQAMANQDIDKIKAGIAEFEKTIAPPSKQPKTTTQNPLESQLEPSETVNAGAPRDTGKGQRHKKSDIDKFYLDQTKGLWRGREKEAAALDIEYIRASQEGRIDP